MKILGVSRRFATILLTSFAVAGAVIGGLYVYTAILQRNHARNMVKAEQFKREFDQRLTTGVAAAAVDLYLTTIPVEVLRLDPGRDNKAEYRVTVTKERSPNWYCGTEDVGVIVHFTADRRLERAEVASWSFNCF